MWEEVKYMSESAIGNMSQAELHDEVHRLQTELAKKVAECERKGRESSEWWNRFRELEEEKKQLITVIKAATTFLNTIVQSME